MSSPFANYPVPERSFIPANPSTPAPARGGAAGTRGTGAKRGRKPKNATANANASAPQTPTTTQQSQSGLQWADPQVGSGTAAGSSSAGGGSTPAPSQDAQAALQGLSLPGTQPVASTSAAAGAEGTPGPSGTGGAAANGAPAGEEDGDGEDEILPAMADDDYSAQLSWQSQSKDNLKVLMDNFSPEQYDRFEAYRRHALPKQAVRKVIQQATGQQVSQPVAQIVAGFSKVFVGEIVEKARSVQARRGETGPLSPDHLREAYRMYQEETGRVGAARPLRSKRLFVR
ncbi:TAFII28-domain-containing protein [Lentinus tigrinus ALCF2SS1-7]|uniref:Transcription initiation factor TFIID subunit 11 n=1 Tax=Lentinus tigrinus ALCF2SS1-6 TaxID=1328759 RepID=A0A5C2S0G3_9APHY|nr:TAFII28-domain-containing protein [Lentinus tigrinus ALCF2SS1-6]RPD71181.1 TAFII28-domain-containing protein [Lentinus tigrinus ALCF2SS1-7]